MVVEHAALRAFRCAWANPDTLDPALAQDMHSVGIVDQLFSGLVELTSDLDIVPDVASTWEVLDGGQKYVFHLRDDVRWSDGRPLTAADFEFAWKRVLDPQFGSASARMLYVIRGASAYHQGHVPTPQDVGVHALDDRTLEVGLESPTGYFLQLLAQGAAYPVPRHAVTQHGPAWTEAGHIVTNGAFRLDDWQPNQSLALSRNPSYHGRFGGNIQRIELTLLSDFGATLELYEQDAVDVAAVQFARIDEVRRRHAAELVMAPEAATFFVRFNLARPPFDDARIRRAFTQAVDRDTLADRVLSGLSSPATGGFVPPGIPGHAPAIGLLYNPERARQLLAEAGYAGGLNFPEVTLAMDDTPQSPIGPFIQAQWQENLGVTINLQLTGDGPRPADANPDERPAMFSGGWLADYPDADNFLRVYVAHQVQWGNTAFNQLVETASHVSDQAERIRLYQSADRILVEEAALLPLTYSRHHLLVKPWISHFRMSPLRTWQWRDVVIEPH